ncbi:hypothetical protein [Candidatus Protochlamydia sp. R18]|uniref:hypothetical protein n=1 Tax=Candidatus Protochlamydia sp. R18 TaxID=1353977 RepID=UPI0005AA0C79|nr:hypothetical protein [Candidatus Protochlamydia sp. R18]
MVLKLGGNQISDDQGAEALAQAHASNNTLKAPYIATNQLEVKQGRINNSYQFKVIEDLRWS